MNKLFFSYKTVSGRRERKRFVFEDFGEIGGGNLHRNYTGWKEFQYDMIKS